jgi:2,4-dienoyl-CoA reductase-like NADH-dependent reductase (Old Yellow Enzyme family)
VDRRYLGTPGDLAFNDEIEYSKQLEAWKTWARVCTASGTPAVVQINHPGRQSPAPARSVGYFEKNLAPSAIPLDFGHGVLPWLINTLMFGTPKEMSTDEIQTVVKDFARTARLSAEAGFSGVEIHAAHGYLLAQFLSERSNKRTDEYGGSPLARAKIVIDIIHAIRAAVPSDFCVGIKLNSVDHQSPGELDACLEQLKAISEAGIDFLEVSGGSYENPLVSRIDKFPFIVLRYARTSME